MNTTAVVLVTDSGFLAPSLVVARQLKAFGIGEIADILIFVVDLDENLLAQVERDFGRDFRIVPLDDRSYVPDDMSGYRKGHVPITTLARLVIAARLEPRYRDIVYVDGDMQILRDPSALFRLRVPDGCIAAAPGSSWIERIEGRPHYENIGRLGLDADSYFNAGLLAVSRDTWAEKGPEALRFYLGNSAECKVHDQTALNVVFAGKVKSLSPVYNFHHLYSEAGAQRLVAPRIVHFTGPHKPWSGSPPTWYGAFRPVYADFVREFPYLGETLRISDPLAPHRISMRLRTLYSHAWRDRRTMAARRRAIARRVNETDHFLA